MSTLRIVTHGGQAHMDEVLAVALILATQDCSGGVEISRRDPTAEELNDPTVWVVDVGMTHDESKRNFDHHQYRGGKAAFQLVAGHLGLGELAEQVYPWWKVAGSIDTEGPFKAAAGIGCSPDALFALQSPLQSFLVRAFAENAQDEGELLQRFGQDLIAHLTKVRERLERLSREAEITRVSDIEVIHHAIAEDPSLAMEIFRRQVMSDAGVSVTPDDRGAGWTLYRFADHPRVNFSKLEGHREVLFAHKGGFIAKTKTRLSRAEVEGLLGLAIT